MEISEQRMQEFHAVRSQVINALPGELCETPHLLVGAFAQLIGAISKIVGLSREQAVALVAEAFDGTCRDCGAPSAASTERARLTA